MADSQRISWKEREEESEDGLSLVDVLRVLRQNRWFVLGAVALCVALAALVTRMQDRVYEGETSLWIEEQRSSMSLLADLGSLTGRGNTAVETDMAVLQSRQIAEAVVDSLFLHVRASVPGLPRDDMFQVHAAPVVPRRRDFHLERLSAGAYRVSSSSGDSLGTARPGARWEAGGLALTLRPGLAASGPERMVVTVHPYRRTVADLRRAMSVSRASRDVMIVQMSYRDTDPVLSAEVPNVAAESFIRYKTGVGRQESGGVVDFLREQVGLYAGQLRDAEGVLQDFRERAQVVSPVDEASEQVKRLAARRAERDGMVAERDALARLLERVSATPTSETGRSPYRQLAAFPTFLQNRAVQDLLQSITALENRRSDLLVQRTESNFDVESVTARIRELETQLYQTARAYLESVDSQIRSLDADLGRFDAQMAAIPAREVEFARRLREQKLLEELYTLLQTRLKEAEIAGAVEPSNVRVVDAALVPERPVSPVPLRNLMVGVLVGLIVGLGGALGREALDTKIRTKEDAASLAGGVPILATIPRIGVHHPSLFRRGRQAAAPDQVLAERLVAQHDPHSPVSEAYRALRTNLTFSRLEARPHLLVVTSAMPGDGKSTSASNLAVTLTQQGTRTLLVDADLRKGMLHRIFGIVQEPGLTHVLLGYAELDAALREFPVADAEHPLYLLPAGVFPPNPAEILGSARMRALAEELRSRFDTVIFDAPPLNLVTDAAILGTFSDSTIVVARAGATEKDALRHATEQLQLLRAPVGGVVLNDFQSPSGSYYGYGSPSRHSTLPSANGKRAPKAVVRG